MGAGLVLPPSPTRHRRPRGPQETVEAAPESSRRALQMSNLARPTGRSPKEVMSDRAKRTTKRRTTYVVLDGLGDSAVTRNHGLFQLLVIRIASRNQYNTVVFNTTEYNSCISGVSQLYKTCLQPSVAHIHTHTMSSGCGMMCTNRLRLLSVGRCWTLHLSRTTPY